MRKKNCEFESGYYAETGLTATHKGYFSFVELEDYACWVVAEKLDSCEDKDSAKLAVERVLADFVQKPSLSKSRIRQCLENAHQKLISESEKIMLRTSLAMVVTDYSKIVWAIAGNVRLYHFRQGDFNFRSKDQTMAQVMFDAGNLGEAEINIRNERNALLNYLGITTEFKPWVSNPYPLEDGDQILLCTLGFWENFKTVEITQALSAVNNSKDCVEKLRETLVNRAPKPGRNYLLAVISLSRTAKGVTLPYMGLLRKVAIIAFLLLLGGIGFRFNQVDNLKFWIIPPTRLKTAVKARVQHHRISKKTVTQKNSDWHGTPLLTPNSKNNSTNESEQSLEVIDQEKPVLDNSVRIADDPTNTNVESDNIEKQQNLKEARKQREAAELRKQKVVAEEARKQREAAELRKQKVAAEEARKQREAEELRKLRVAAEEARKQREAEELHKQRVAAEEARKQREAEELRKQKVAAEEARKQREVEELRKQKVAAEKQKVNEEARKLQEAEEWRKAKASEEADEYGIVEENAEIQVKSESAELQKREEKEKINPPQTAQPGPREENAREMKLSQAINWEKSGDQKYNAAKYDEALNLYKMARNIYKELGKTREVKVLDYKINDTINKKIMFKIKRGIKKMGL
jgi:serine/threonine protein phosphatase PrpC